MCGILLGRIEGCCPMGCLKVTGGGAADSDEDPPVTIIEPIDEVFEEDAAAAFKCSSGLIGGSAPAPAPGIKRRC